MKNQLKKDMRMITQSDFQSLWQSILLDGSSDDSESLYNTIIQYYSSSDRHYHNISHLRYVMGQYHRIKDNLDDPKAVAMALWFHDIIYEIGKRDNERKSADFFLDASKNKMPDDFRHKVEAMIMATTHQVQPTDPDTCYVTDIDLSGMGDTWEHFDKNSQDIRLESCHLSDEEFHTKQIGFLSNLVQRENLYLTPFYQEHREKQARQNLACYFAMHQ